MQEETLETMPITRATFHSLNLFKGVLFESIAGYLLTCPIINAKEGDVLINPKTEERRLLILIDGLLEVKMEGKEGMHLGDVRPGTCVGEMSVFDNADPSAWVIAKMNSTLLSISAPTAKAILNVSHPLCLNMIHILSQRVRYSNKIVFAEQNHIKYVEQNATIDPLTGLHNRHWLESMYTREMKRSNAGNFALAAFMVDIDHFKKINDTYGHLAGDQILMTVAQTLVEALRPSDMPVRFGGEEFTVFLPGTTPDNAAKIAERIRSSIEKKKIKLESGGQEISITVSLGYAAREDGDTVNSIIDKSDKALYYAKNTGRNRACQYVKGM
ncbi:MAG: GGDEF domain-containing protein [Fibrobacteraceae bacterium]|nr:GGDEF domain-containing protein [Fibrobacteraceae bacterium]